MKQITKNKNSITLFKMPETVKAEDVKKVREIKFEPLAPSFPADITSGWCDPVNISDTRDFDNSALGGLHVYGVRIDSFSYPASQLEVIENQLAIDKGLPLKKHHKREIKERAKARLREKSVPGSKMFPVVFDFLSGRIIAFTQSKNELQQFIKLFERTFMASLNDAEISIFKSLDLNHVYHKGDFVFESAKASNERADIKTIEPVNEIDRIMESGYVIDQLGIVKDGYAFEITNTGKIKNIDIDVPVSERESNLIEYKCQKLVEYFEEIVGMFS